MSGKDGQLAFGIDPPAGDPNGPAPPWAALAACLDALPYYVLLVDARHRILFASRPALAALGLAAGQALGAYCPAAVHGLDAPFPGCPLEEALRVGHAVETELQDHRTGAWLASAVYPTELRTSDGAPVFLHTVRDITEQRRAARAAARAGEVQGILADLLRLGDTDITTAALLDAVLARLLSIPWLSVESRGAVLLTDAAGTALEMAAHRGLESDTVTACRRVPFGFCMCGRAAASRVIEFADGIDDRHDVRLAGMAPHGHYCVPLLCHGAVLGVINLYLRPGHRRDEAEERFLAAVADAVAGMIMRRQAEEALRQSEERFRTVVSSMSDSMLTLDRAGRVTGVFGRDLEQHGLPPESLLGKTAREVFDPALAAVHEEANARALAGEAVTYEWRLACAERLLHLQTSMSAVRDPLGAVTGLVLVSRDITERKELEGRLAIADRMASMGTLAAGVAHEINSPLAVVVANLDFALESLAPQQINPGGASSPAEIASALRDAREASNHVRQIVRDLKRFSRPDEEQRGPVDLRGVLESSLRMAWNEIRHRARLVKLYGEVPQVLANEARLGQVFVNLVVNAAQAMPDGGADGNTITIRTATHPSGRALVEVQDTGPGMPPAVLARIFEPFFTTKAVGAGTGLGLSICHRIVTELGGEIQVDSAVGAGTTFRVLLPAAAATAADPAPPAAHGPAARRGRVLVVDDDQHVCRALARLLAPHHDVVAATRGKEALRAIAVGPRFDLILCDLMMPEMSGAQLHAEVTQIDPALAGRMVFVSGGAFSPGMKEFLEGVPNARVDKPFDTQQLLAVISGLTG